MSTSQLLRSFQAFGLSAQEAAEVIKEAQASSKLRSRAARWRAVQALSKRVVRRTRRAA